MTTSYRTSRVLDEPVEFGPPFNAGTGDTQSPETDGAEPADPVREATASARAEGYRVGHERASAEVANEIEDFRRKLAEALQRLAGLEADLTRSHQTRLMEIALEAASRIVRERIDSGDPVASRALEEALAALPDHATFRARLHPDDEDSVSAMLRAEIETGRVELIGDPGVDRGGIRVESEAGRVDATIETAEAAVRAAVLGEESGS